MSKQFLSCDWGTSSFRLSLVDAANGNIIYQQHTAEGIASTYAQWKASAKDESNRLNFFLSSLSIQIQKLAEATGTPVKDLPIIISGMASSSIGMFELPYTPMPFAVSGEDLQIKKIERAEKFPNDIILISGATNGTDVMRGEETQLIGCVNNNASAKHVFIFPGTHSKHISVLNGRATTVETYMSGEFFELLANKSILADSIAADGNIDEPENKNAFAQGIKESKSENLLHSSFMVRTNQLFKKCSKTANYFYLSGLLIGTELNQLFKKDIEGITIAGGQKLIANYSLALSLLNANVKVATEDGVTATVKGQLAIYRRVYV